MPAAYFFPHYSRQSISIIPNVLCGYAIVYLFDQEVGSVIVVEDYSCAKNQGIYSILLVVASSNAISQTIGKGSYVTLLVGGVDSIVLSIIVLGTCIVPF